jgi:sterol desaturase/sphingolipid hydroxylase (fatty acid hydroxylase superfamily)
MLGALVLVHLPAGFFAANGGVEFVLLLAAAAALFTVQLYTWVASFAVTDLGGHWWTWPALILAEDFCYYWYHRAGHEVRLFWASHVNHHSSRHYNLSTALRQSWTTPFTGWVFWVPMLLGGFPVELVLLQKGISLLYQYWIHTELIGRMGPLEWVMNTPSHHRVHHGRNLRYLDRNYGGIFIIWDRLFGTFQVEDEPVEYGLIHNLESHNPVVIAMHEWWAIGRDIAARPAAVGAEWCGGEEAGRRASERKRERERRGGGARASAARCGARTPRRWRRAPSPPTAPPSPPTRPCGRPASPSTPSPRPAASTSHWPARRNHRPGS